MLRGSVGTTLVLLTNLSGSRGVIDIYRRRNYIRIYKLPQINEDEGNRTNS